MIKGVLFLEASEVFRKNRRWLSKYLRNIRINETGYDFYHCLFHFFDDCKKVRGSKDFEEIMMIIRPDACIKRRYPL